MNILQGYNPIQLAQIAKGIDPKYIKPRTKGGKTYRYVEASYVVELLNQMFGHIWNWQLDEPGVRTFMGTKYVKETKQTVPEEKSLVFVKGSITVPVLNPNYDEANSSYKDKYIWITKESFGSHPLLGNDAETQGYAYKAAATDALKKCASMLGIAKNVYMSEEMFEYLQEEGLADEWTDETIATLKDQYDQMMALYDNNKETLPTLINKFCDETKDYTAEGRITPSNVIHFLEWYQNLKPVDMPEIDKLEIEEQTIPAFTTQRSIPKF